MAGAVIANIDVSDVRAAVAFYTEGVGVEFKRWLFGGSVAEMSIGGTVLHLIEQEPGSTAVSGTHIRRDYSAHWTPVHLDVLVADLEVALAKAVGAGAVPSGEAMSEEYGRFITLRDPFGNGFCLLQLQNAGYDSASQG